MKEKYHDNHLQCDPPNPSLGIYQKEIKMYVHQKWVLNIHNSLKLEKTQISINGRAHKHPVVYLHKGILLRSEKG